jgi:hypothetical protein
MKALKPNFTRTLCPEGTYLARVFQIIYLGTQKSKTYGNENRKVRINWELPTKKFAFKEGDEPQPFAVANEYTVSMGKKSSLRPVVEALLGVQLKDEEAYAFDVDDIMGHTCQVTVVHTEDGQYANVGNVAAMLDGVTCPPAVNPPQILTFEKWDDALFQKLPPFIRTRIETSPEYANMKNGKKVDELDEIKPSDIPF